MVTAMEVRLEKIAEDFPTKPDFSTAPARPPLLGITGGHLSAEAIADHFDVSPGVPSFAAGCQSPMDRFFNPHTPGGQSPTKGFFDGLLSSEILTSDLGPIASMQGYSAHQGCGPQPYMPTGFCGNMSASSPMWAMMPSTAALSAPLPANTVPLPAHAWGAPMSVNVADASSIAQTERSSAPPLPSKSRSAHPKAAEVSTKEDAPPVPRAVFVDLSCIRERSSDRPNSTAAKQLAAGRWK